MTPRGADDLSGSSDEAVTREGGDSGAFLLRRGGRRVGRLDYRVEGSIVAIDYVVVDGSLRGRGLGARLVDAAAAWARETGRTLHPYCGYAARVLRADVRYADVLTPGAGASGDGSRRNR